MGYYIWCFCDNFEWARGEHPASGIVYVDYKTQQRIPKGAYWYRKNHRESRVLKLPEKCLTR